MLASSSLDMADKDEFKTGAVKWYNPHKGWGYISLDDSPGDVYIHQTEIKMPGFRKLLRGTPVRFHVAIDAERNKPYAYNVIRIGSPEDIMETKKSARADQIDVEIERISAAEEAERIAEALEAANNSEQESADISVSKVAQREEDVLEAAAEAIAEKLEEEMTFKLQQEEEEKIAAASEAAAKAAKAADPFSSLKNFFKF
jgi:CspA family cold shock protein